MTAHQSNCQQHTKSADIPRVPQHIDVRASIDQYLYRQINKTPEAAALHFYGREISYRDLGALIDRCAHTLVRHGIKKGDRVGLYLQNCPQFVIGFFGILRAGGIVVCLNPMYKSVELKTILRSTTPSAIIAQNNLTTELGKLSHQHEGFLIFSTTLRDFAPGNSSWPLPDEFLNESKPAAGAIDLFSAMDKAPAVPFISSGKFETDTALLQLTGGTTGTPKAAIISMKAFTTAVLGSSSWFGLSSQDRTLGVAPFFHIMGLQVSMVPTLISGGKLVILSRFHPETVARALSEQQCTNCVGAPTMWNGVVNMKGIRNYDFSHLRLIITGGSPISTTLQQQIKKIFPASLLGEGYGMTEVLAHGGALTPVGRWKSGFIGISPINEIKIVNIIDGGREMAPNEVGEILIKGPTVMTGYWGKPEETNKAITADGWFLTGDIGLLDEEGYLKIVDRKKALILCGGYNVYPSDVEHLISLHPAVKETAVIGIPDDYRGESPKAFVTIKNHYRRQITELDLLHWCKENMAVYKCPSAIEFRDSLPTSAVGKIIKRSLI